MKEYLIKRGEMNLRTLLILSMVLFTGFCGFLVWQCGCFDSTTAVNGCIGLVGTSQLPSGEAPSEVSDSPAELNPNTAPRLGADHGEIKTIVIGAKDPNTENPETGFKFQLRLTSKGAGIDHATFSNGEGKGFATRDPKNPQPLEILSPVNQDVYSMANGKLNFPEYSLALPLDRLHWSCGDAQRNPDGSGQVTFYTTIKDRGNDEDVLRISKTYTVEPGSYLVDCKIKFENLSLSEQKISFNLNGPVGLDREGVRSDMRKAVGGFKNAEGKITSDRLNVRKLQKAKELKDLRLEKNSDRFLWAASVNKYFAAIVVPVAKDQGEFAKYIENNFATYYDPDGQANSSDEAVGVNLQIARTTLGAARSGKDVEEYDFKLFLGPKEKRLFTDNPYYKELGFIQTIDFMGCCCPAAIINPLAFGILGAMEWMYSFIPNYGVVIIILVLIIRLVMHPVTKKSQISMSKMTKLGPMAEEIKKKYANNKAEMQKQIMQLYKKQGASPVMGFLPMLIQMPIWIALYSAIYASISLRGAQFLPVWITDLSAPDALVTFSTITIPMVKWHISSFNLLPILMGVAMYLQQKMMPSQAGASTNPQMEQQQKMMKIMMPLMFPLMLYNAPSGLNLYIMASTFAGVIEQHVIRKHIREKEEAESLGKVAVTSKTGGKIKKKKPKPFYKM